LKALRRKFFPQARNLNRGLNAVHASVTTDQSTRPPALSIANQAVVNFVKSVALKHRRRGEY
jgi:hypothetical protein